MTESHPERLPPHDVLTGRLLLLATAFIVAAEWSGVDLFNGIARVAACAALLLLAPRVKLSGHLFLAVAALLTVTAVAVLPDWQNALGRALGSMAFITAFFVALACLRNAAGGSAAIIRCGSYLANQPSGRRYLALTGGGHLFSLVLNYGSISLFGSLVERSLRNESDAMIRRIRTRRMLIAVQRGFITTLCWSPLTFSMVVSLSVVPGSSWAAAAPYCIVAALLLGALGWGLDTLFKPKVANPPPPAVQPPGAWRALLPLFALLALLVVVVGVLVALTGLNIVPVVMLVVPLLSLAWAALQKSPPTVGVLMMAGYIGMLASALLVPLIGGSWSADGWSPLFLIGLLWLIPLAGQIGMNPILIVTLIGPLLPAAAQLGVAPELVVLALTSGWALGGASSPFTATTLLIGAFGGVSARHVGLVWNGLYTVTGGLVASLWLWLLIIL